MPGLLDRVELAGGTRGAVEDDLLPAVVIEINEQRFPALGASGCLPGRTPRTSWSES